MNAVRKLTTILVADIAGYSRMMGADEAATLRALAECRGLIDPLIVRHQGRIFGSAGDNVLAEFPSAVGAVAAAVDMQLVLAMHQADKPEARRARRPCSQFCTASSAKPKRAANCACDSFMRRLTARTSTRSGTCTT